MNDNTQALTRPDSVTNAEMALIGGDALRSREAALKAKQQAVEMDLPLDGITILGGKVYVNNKGLTIMLRRDERGPGSVAVEVVKDAWDDCILDTIRQRMGSTSKDAVARWADAGLMRAKCKARISFPDGSHYEAYGDASIITMGMPAMHNPDYANHMAECVPLRSEILTRDGFKHFDEVSEGDEVLAYDTATDACVWTHLRAVTVHGSLPMHRLSQRRGWSVDCTSGHSWAVETWEGQQGAWRHRHILRPLESLKASDRLIVAAPAPDGPLPLTDIEAAILGWLATDGSVRRIDAHRGKRDWSSWRGHITQSKPTTVAVLRDLLGDSVAVSVTPATTRTFPSGRTYNTQTGYRFHLPARLVTALFTKAGMMGMEDLPRVVTRLSVSARAAMLDAMMLGDGTARGVFGKKQKPGVMDAYQILATLQGRALGIPCMSSVGDVPTQTLRKRRTVSVSVLHRTSLGNQAAWCPTTDFGTWVMRQDGNVMITGNTRSVNRAIRRATGLDTTAEEMVGGVSRDAVAELGLDLAADTPVSAPTRPTPSTTATQNAAADEQAAAKEQARQLAARINGLCDALSRPRPQGVEGLAQLGTDLGLHAPPDGRFSVEWREHVIVRLESKLAEKRAAEAAAELIPPADTASSLGEPWTEPDVLNALAAATEKDIDGIAAEIGLSVDAFVLTEDNARQLRACVTLARRVFTATSAGSIAQVEIDAGEMRTNLDITVDQYDALIALTRRVRSMRDWAGSNGANSRQPAVAAATAGAGAR